VISRALASELDYQRIVRNVADFVYRLVGVQFVYVAVPETEGFRLVAVAGRNQHGSSVSDIKDASPGMINEALLNRAAQEKRPVVVTDIETEPDMESWRAQAQAQDWQSMAAVPLLSQNQVVGVLGAYASQINFFTAGDVATLMSLASQAAVAIQNAQLFAELEAQREKLHQVSLRLVNAQEEERRRISRELHDELGQALTALKINLDVARRFLTPEAPRKLNQSVNEAGSLAMQTLESARNLSLELHPAILDDLGLVAALRWEIDRFEQRTDQAVQFKANLAETTLQPELEITTYRIITESLTNIVRHAQADTIAVQLQVEDDQIAVIVEDNGIGFDAAAWFNSPTGRQSLGLVSMRERAELLGGQLEVISQPGCGTKIWARLPFKQ
jgi:signal transduction histidine kinase